MLVTGLLDWTGMLYRLSIRVATQAASITANFEAVAVAAPPSSEESEGDAVASEVCMAGVAAAAVPVSMKTCGWYETLAEIESKRALVAMPEELGFQLGEGVILAVCFVLEEVAELVEDVEELCVLEELLELEVVLVLEVELAAELVGIAAVADEVSSSSPPFSKTTTWAFSPLGTVTTQKAPSPAPPVVVSPETSLTLFVFGSILQGRPLQPPPSHSISTP